LGWTLPQHKKAESAFLRSLTPTAAVRAKLQDISSYTIGVHARRGDNRTATRSSTTEGFLAAIAERLCHRPLARLFVASDDSNFVTAVRAAYPDIVLAREHINRDRHHPEGIRDALVDLLMLSRCQEILGSVHSSFSECAAAFHGVELRRVATCPPTSL
jgi:hypothetical protein